MSLLAALAQNTRSARDRCLAALWRARALDVLFDESFAVASLLDEEPGRDQTALTDEGGPNLPLSLVTSALLSCRAHFRLSGRPYQAMLALVVLLLRQDLVACPEAQPLEYETLAVLIEQEPGSVPNRPEAVAFFILDTITRAAQAAAALSPSGGVSTPARLAAQVRV